MADKKLFEQPLKSTVELTDRLPVGVPGQEGCDNVLMSDFIDQLKNTGVVGGSFSNASLTANVLTINHEKDTSFVELTVYDSGGYLQDLSGMMRIVDVDNISVDFGGEITGVWTYILKYWYL